jgi:hypothetical protein
LGGGNGEKKPNRKKAQRTEKFGLKMI